MNCLLTFDLIFMTFSGGFFAWNALHRLRLYENDANVRRATSNLRTYIESYGRYKTRTCDILLVRQALYQLS